MKPPPGCRANHAATLPGKLIRGSAILCLAFLLGACLPEPPSPTPIPPTSTATVTPTATATIIWFPPTETPTPAPTQRIAPTQDTSPVYGPVIYSDNFTDKTRWQTRQSGAGNISYGDGELTLAVSEAKGTLTSLSNNAQLNDFYLEMDVTPSLCRGADNFGLLVRVNSSQNFYRVMLSCNGQVRLERYRNAYTAPLQDWTGSGQLFPGELTANRLGVWASGSEIRVYINRVLQFSVKDPVFSSGGLGVYARSAGETPLTVSFSNLVVYQVASGQPRPLPSATPRPASTRPSSPTTRPPG